MIGLLLGDINSSTYQSGTINKIDLLLNDHNMHNTYRSLLALSVMDVFNNLYSKLDTTTTDELKSKIIKLLNEYYSQSLTGSDCVIIASVSSYVSKSLKDARSLARTITSILHQNDNSIKASEAYASALYLSLNNYSKEEIKSYIESNFYPNLFKSNDDIPLSIKIFLESNSFEDTVINSINSGYNNIPIITSLSSLIAQSYYKNIDILFYLKKLKLYLKPELFNILNRFNYLYLNDNKYIFLDVDGVLNNFNFNSNNNLDLIFDINNIKTLKDIIYKTNSKIVVTSSRCDFQYTLEPLKEEFKKNNIIIKDYLIKNKNDKPSIIQNYIKQNYIKYYCILDDNDFDFNNYYLNNFIKIDPLYGLTNIYTNKIIDNLKKESNEEIFYI